MSDVGVAELVDRGERALAAGDWDGARAAFAEAVAADPSPQALDGLGRTLWWLGDVDAAIEHRERAYAALRASGATDAAAMVALWLSREYLEAIGNEPASNGWLARAEGLVRERPDRSAQGWLELTRGGRAFDAEEMRTRAESALEHARRRSDPTLEASALALLGRASLLAGEFDAGVAALDEAMVAITSGETTDPVVFGDVCCVVTLACEESGELERLMAWNDVVEKYLSRHLHGPLISWCGTCGAEFFQSKGDIGMAERCLVEALGALAFSRAGSRRPSGSSPATRISRRRSGRASRSTG
jgi:tetratricopeptide (TPR) repeat protein